jgi:hypothetical protein
VGQGLGVRVTVGVGVTVGVQVGVGVPVRLGVGVGLGVKVAVGLLRCTMGNLASWGIGADVRVGVALGGGQVGVGGTAQGSKKVVGVGVGRVGLGVAVQGGVHCWAPAAAGASVLPTWGKRYSHIAAASSRKALNAIQGVARRIITPSFRPEASGGSSLLARSLRQFLPRKQYPVQMRRQCIFILPRRRGAVKVPHWST